MGYAIFNEEVFVNRSFQVIVPGYIGAGWQSIRPNDIVGRDLGTTATIIELVCGVDAAIRTVGIHFASRYKGRYETLVDEARAIFPQTSAEIPPLVDKNVERDANHS